MFTSIAVGRVKSFNCSHFLYVLHGRSVRKISVQNLKKCTEISSTINSYSPKCLPVSMCHSSYRSFPSFSTLTETGRPSFLTSRVTFSKFLARHYQTKSKDCNKEDDDHSDTESKTKTMLDDLEFQNLLKDFAQDFGVNEESSKILEEIKQTQGLHGDDGEKPGPSTTKISASNDQLNAKNSSSETLQLNSDNLSNLENSTESRTTGGHRYKEFKDQDSIVIPSSEEIVNGLENEGFFHIDQELEKFPEYVTERGKEGVFDIHELVDLLREENLIDIAVIQIPPKFHYTDYLVLATGKSPRHCQAVMEHIIKCYKKKKNEKDPHVIGVGEKTTWKAIDMGNIVLHVFLEETRDFYDIESVWLLDRKYDSSGMVEKDPKIEAMQQHFNFLNALNPE